MPQKQSSLARKYPHAFKDVVRNLPTNPVRVRFKKIAARHRVRAVRKHYSQP